MNSKPLTLEEIEAIETTLKDEMAKIKTWYEDEAIKLSEHDAHYLMQAYRSMASAMSALAILHQSFKVYRYGETR